MRRFVLFFACIAALAVSCVHEEAPQEPRTSYAISGVNPTDEMENPTKSVFVGDDGQITSITLFAFDSDGNIMVYGEEAGATYAGKRIEQYAESGGEIEWLLPISEEPYDIYAVANLGDFRGRFATVDELVSSPDMEWSSELLSSSSDIGIPMRSILEGVTGGEDYILPMRRVVARFDLTLRNFDSGRLIWFDICNVNATVNVFGVNECADADDMADLHEYATEQDIETLNAGGTVSFYVPENMQTTAGNYSLTGNKAWKETAGKLADKYGLSQASDAECTYINIQFKRDSEPKPEAYFLYLGDGRNNFDVERGKKKNITANVGGPGPVTGGDDEVTTISISDGFHEAGEFYAASKVRADIKFSSAEASAWSEGFTVQSKDANGNVVISWDTPVKTGDNTYVVIGTCKKPGNDASFDFINTNGRATSMGTVTVKKPGIRLTSNGAFFAGDSEVKWNESSEPSVEINGTDKYLYVYLVDDQGRNLNQAHGIDRNLVNFSYMITTKDKSRTLSNISFTPIASLTQGSYIGKALHSVSNTGTDASTNEKLTLMAGELGSKLYVRENAIGLEELIDHSIIVPEIEISLGTSLDYPTTSYLYYQIKNQSKLPFDITSMSMFSAHSNTTSDVENNFYSGMRVGRLCFPTGISSWVDGYNLFMLKNPVYSFSLEGGRTIQESDGVYYLGAAQYSLGGAASNIDSFHFPKYNNMQTFYSRALYHILKASMKYENENCAENISFKFNPLPKESENDNALWGSSGLNDTGLTAYTCHGDAYTINETRYSNYFSCFGNVMTTHAKKVIEDGVVNVDIKFNDQHQLVITASEPVSLSVSVNGLIHSHIRCLQFNDLYPGKSCYYHKYVQGITPFSSQIDASKTASVVDVGIADAFSEIREQELYSVMDGGMMENEWYFDGPGYGSYREHLKPYKLEMGFNITSDRIISVTLPEELSYDYKKSPAVDWGQVAGYRGYFQPSADTSIHSDCDNCLGGEYFKEEIVILKVNSMPLPSISIGGGTVTPLDPLISFDYPVYMINF